MGYGFWSGVEKWIKKEFFDKVLPYLAHSPWLNLYNFGCFWVIQNLISVFSYEIFKYLYVLSLKNVLKYGCRALVNTGTRGRLGGCARNFWGMYLYSMSPFLVFLFAIVKNVNYKKHMAYCTNALLLKNNNFVLRYTYPKTRIICLHNNVWNSFIVYVFEESFQL